MNDLNLMIRFSSLDPNASTEVFESKQAKYLKIGSINKIGTFLLIAIAVACSFAFNYGAIVNHRKQSAYFTITSTVFYFIASAMLATSLLCLLSTLKSKFDDNLKLEIDTLLTFMIYFTVTFCIRGIAIIMVYPFRIWPQFNYDWYNGDFTWYSIVWWSIQFVFYTVIPITYLAVVHHLNFRNRAHYSASPTLFNHKSSRLTKDIHGVLLDATSLSSSSVLKSGSNDSRLMSLRKSATCSSRKTMSQSSSSTSLQMPLSHDDGPNSLRPVSGLFGQESERGRSDRRLVSSLNLEESQKLKEYVSMDPADDE